MSKIIYTIYKIINLINNKIYIGFTSKSIQERFRGHIKESNKKKINCAIHKAIKKYKLKNFTIESIYESTDKDYTLNVMESHFIKEYNSNNPKIGYNMTSGGNGNDGVRTQKTKNKISSTLIGHIPWNKGKHHTEKTKEKIRLKNTGRIVSEETRNKLSIIGKVRTYTLERNEKISKKLKGRNKDIKYRNNISQTLKNNYKNGYINPMTGKKNTMKIVICSYCKKNGGIQNMKRYHFNNCKKKQN